jgi:hypothetical protein
VFSTPIDKRKEAWLKELANIVNELCQEIDGLTLDRISENQEFISASLEASNIAVRTHHQEKLKALKAAVKNTVLRADLDESKKMIFIRIIGQMTPLHFQVLNFLSFPEKYINAFNSQNDNTLTHWGDLRNVWDARFKEIRSDNPIIEIAIQDLYSYGLIYINVFHKANLSSVATKFGREFIEFAAAAD